MVPIEMDECGSVAQRASGRPEFLLQLLLPTLERLGRRLWTFIVHYEARLHTG